MTIQKLKELLPIFTIYIIVAALMKLFVYYNYFNIPIVNCIGLGELGIIISGDFLFYIPFTAIIVIVLIGFYNSINENSNRILQAIKNTAFLFISMALMIICLLSIFFLKGYLGPITFFSIYILSSVFFMLHYSPLKEPGKLIKFESNYFVVSFLIILIAVIIRSAASINETKNGRYKGTNIILSDTTYISTDSSYYIGKTERFVYLYNEPTMTATIIPITEVKTIKLKINKNIR